MHRHVYALDRPFRALSMIYWDPLFLVYFLYLEKDLKKEKSSNWLCKAVQFYVQALPTLPYTTSQLMSEIAHYQARIHADGEWVRLLTSSTSSNRSDSSVSAIEAGGGPPLCEAGGTINEVQLGGWRCTSGHIRILHITRRARLLGHSSQFGGACFQLVVTFNSATARRGHCSWSPLQRGNPH